jgi:hypothetical protein
MASKNKAQPASDNGAIDTSSDLLAELHEQEVERVELAHGTILETNTVYEDRTDNPEAERDVEYETEDEDLGNGTILTHVLGAKAE